MTVSEIVNHSLNNAGRTQNWVVQEMNLINPDIKMDKSKLSAIKKGIRKMSGDELIAFLKVLEINPDEMLNNTA